MPSPAPHVLTANRLIDGRVVFRDAAGRWVEAFAEAAVLAADAVETALAAAAADVEAREIVGPYAVELVEIDGRLAPKTMREKIRVSGPTSGDAASAPAPAPRSRAA